MKRRTFLQLGGMTVASAFLAGCQSQNEKLIPYLIPPDEGVTPGKATYYASSCSGCPAGCGILVRVSEGRAKKIEGNPQHPVNRGRLCARGQATLQELYHPDRIQQPLRRSGPRGSGKFQKISWSEALNLLAAKLTELQRNQNTDSLALLTPQLSGSLASLTGTFMRSFGSSNHLSYELLTPDWLRLANRQSYGHPDLPFYDLAETRYLLSFGADFVESHLSPVQYGNAFGRMRQGRDTVRGHFTYIGGRMSLTGASADRWMPARPGSEGMLALGLARLILAESLYDKADLSASGIRPEELLTRLQGYDLQRVAEETGLAKDSIIEVAREFATTRPSLAMAGETVAYQSNGREAVRAIQLLNTLVGNLNRPGGVYPASSDPLAGTLARKESSFSELQALIAGMRAGKIKAALIKGNPVHTVPPATGFQTALDSVPFIVSFATLLDDTALQADLVLPDNAALESWGDVVPLAGSRAFVYGTMQPVVAPLYDTRQFADVLLAAASRLGGSLAAALPQKSFVEYLKSSLAQRFSSGKEEDFESLWVELLRNGGQFTSEQWQEKYYRWSSAAVIEDPPPPVFAGEAKQFPLNLQVYPSTAFHDGRGTPFPWLQQMPDPMSTVVWDSWIEINPTTAATLGINQGDLVEVISPRSSLRLPAVIYPGIRPDMVAIPLGQGHKGGGRYAKDRGVNPLTLLSLLKGKEQHAAWNATRVRIIRISQKGNLVTAGHPEGSYRSELIGI
ncbi:MAG: nitrate reductase [Deltaproteobacteria bacterium]|nr:nitrate reductase [Deltaproteobacteria bacterium]TLN01910.1 MAG: nitrate reductase [bacterium]